MNQYSRLTSFPSAVSPRRTAATAVLTRSAVRRVALLGNHLPRQCGIATFTTDLSDAIAGAFPEIDCFVLAMNDAGARYAYPQRVRFEIAESDLASYRRAADFLNVNTVDVALACSTSTASSAARRAATCSRCCASCGCRS